MHWVCFVWTLTLPFSGWRTPNPGPVRVCVCVLPLARSGGAGLPGAFWCASPFPRARLSALFVCSTPSGLGMPRLSFLLCFLFPLVRPRCPQRFVFPSPRCLRPWRLVVLLPPLPLLFFFSFSLCAPVVSGVLCFPVRGALGLGVLWSSGPPPCFSFLLSPHLAAPPPFFCFFSFCLPCFFFLSFPFFSSASTFVLFAVVCRLCAAGSGLCVLGCAVW